MVRCCHFKTSRQKGKKTVSGHLLDPNSPVSVEIYSITHDLAREPHILLVEDDAKAKDVDPGTVWSANRRTSDAAMSPYTLASMLETHRYVAAILS